MVSGVGLSSEARATSRRVVPKNASTAATAVVSTNGVSPSYGAEALAILWRGKRRRFHENSIDKKHLRV